jgi:hypothetical protein
MNKLNSYYAWLDSLDHKKRVTFQLIMTMIHEWSNERRKELWAKYNFKRAFALVKYKNQKNFIQDELFKASEELTRVDLPCDWDLLYSKIDNIQRDIETAKEENRFTYIIDHDDKYEILFKDVFMNADVIEDYLNTDIDFENPGSYWQLMRKIKHAEKFVELFGRFYWLVDLINIIESDEHSKEIKIAKQFSPLPDCFINKEDFHKYFSNPKVADLYFKNDEGVYFLKQGKKASLAGLAQILKNKGKLIDSIKTNQDLAKVFCTFFHVDYNKIEDKQFQPDRAKIDEFYFIK